MALLADRKCTLCMHVLSASVLQEWRRRGAPSCPVQCTQQGSEGVQAQPAWAAIPGRRLWRPSRHTVHMHIEALGAGCMPGATHAGRKVAACARLPAPLPDQGPQGAAVRGGGGLGRSAVRGKARGAPRRGAGPHLVWPWLRASGAKQAEESAGRWHIQYHCIQTHDGLACLAVESRRLTCAVLDVRVATTAAQATAFACPRAHTAARPSQLAARGAEATEGAAGLAAAQRQVKDLEAHKFVLTHRVQEVGCA